ncbi:McrC family protein [Dyella jiangningensis]|uniref:Restriction endonuclease n=1 Tax=Dyella jiangningensis TaxID=1379159 RepID=A0A328P2P5_9GAMM|nr:hypothetical protein [Dyella jiangningensis]RAO74922.1 hypothetical protein CA260_19165 [Dyella jiangningensis]
MASPASLAVLEHEFLPYSSRTGVTSHLSERDVRALHEANVSRPGFCEFLADGVRFNQFCGIVGFQSRSLEILPKVGGQDHPDSCRSVLLRCLQDAGLAPRRLRSEAAQALNSATLLDAFIGAYLDEVAVLLQQGLYKRYRTDHEDLHVVRGKVVFRRQAAALANRPDVIHCAFDELTSDNALNRLLKYALHLVSRAARGQLQKRSLTQLWSFVDIADMVHHGKALSSLTFDRQSERYRSAFQWACWIVQLLSPSLRSGATQAPSLLFDMNKVFEGLVSRKIHHDLAYLGGQVDAQDVGTCLATYAGSAAVGLRPDFVVRKAGGIRAIVDAKWKHLRLDASGFPRPSEKDVYQMLAYAAAYKCHDLILVYPWHEGLSRARRAPLLLPMIHGTQVRVELEFIDIADPSYAVVQSRSGTHAGIWTNLLDREGRLSAEGRGGKSTS